jgi:hypothetical protein
MLQFLANLVQARRLSPSCVRHRSPLTLADPLPLVQAAYCWRYSPYPTFLSKLLFWYMISLLFLFGSFYYSKHVVPKKGGDGKKHQ